MDTVWNEFIPDDLKEATILGVGLLGQFFFAIRSLIQWILSEKAKKVVSPLLFWVFSIMGSYLFFVYGWLRKDFAIILGQSISYYVYLWNLNAHQSWKKQSIMLRILLLLTPIAAGIGLILSGESITKTLFENREISTTLLLFGSLGQAVFTLRFIYQVIYSAKRKQSLLPLGFWLLSLLGSSIIIIYGFLRSDIVLILGQLAGWVIYIRNIHLEVRSRRPSSQE